MSDRKTIHFSEPVVDVVVIPRNEYDALRQAAEDIDDISAFDGAKRRLDKGEDEMIPDEFAKRLINGENPVRVFRQFRGVTIKSLAQLSNVSAAYLSQIETGKRDGTMPTMQGIAQALGVTLDDLA